MVHMGSEIARENLHWFQVGKRLQLVIVTNVELQGEKNKFFVAFLGDGAPQTREQGMVILAMALLNLGAGCHSPHNIFILAAMDGSETAQPVADLLQNVYSKQIMELEEVCKVVVVVVVAFTPSTLAGRHVGEN